MKTIKYNRLNNETIKVWEILWKKSPYSNISNSPAWFISAVQAFKHKKILVVSMYSEEGELKAIAGFVQTRAYGVPVFMLPGREFSEWQSLLVDYNNLELTKQFLTEISKLGTLYLTGFSDSIRNLVVNNLKLVTTFVSEYTSYVNFEDGDYGEYPKKKISKLLNKIKRLPYKVYAENTVESHNEAIKKAFDIELTSTKLKKGRGVFHREDARTFYSLLSKRMSSNISVSILYFGQKPVAYTLGFVWKNIFFSSQKAHVGEYNYFSPGRLNKLFLFDYWREKGSKILYFGQGYDAFKMNFTKRIEALNTLIISDNKLLMIYIKLAHNTRKHVYALISNNSYLYSLYGYAKNRLFF